MVLRKLFHLAVPDQVGARVAHVPEGDALVVDERDRDRRAHAGRVRIGARPVVDTAIRLLDEGDDACLAAGTGAALLQLCGGHPRRDLAGLRAAHPVGDGEERRLHDVRVLVVPSLAAGVGHARDPSDHCSYLRSVSPSRTTSPYFNRRGRSSRVPFRYVPFVEPRSCTQTPSCRGSKRAWRADAYSSDDSATSFWPPRPTVSCAEFSS